MKKRLFAIVFALLLSAASVLPVSVMGDMQRLIDGADLLSESEEEELLARLDEISERQQVDIVVITLESLQGFSPMEAADDFYDYYGYGFGAEKDGILFLLSMEERDWHISTVGYGITAVTDAGLEYMSEKFIDDLKDGDYAAAFTTFANLCDDFITQARTGEPYDVGHLPKEPFYLVENLLVVFLVGFVVSLIATGIMRSKLKTVYSRSEADDYIKEGSMRLTREDELFLYRHVEYRRREEEEKEEKEEKPDNSEKPSSSGGSSTHTSSSGVTHGGGGGKF